MLGEWIKQQVREQGRREFDARCDYLCKLPANTFAAIYAENEELFAGVRYNDEYFSKFEIYYASLARDEGYEQLI